MKKNLQLLFIFTAGALIGLTVAAFFFRSDLGKRFLPQSVAAVPDYQSRNFHLIPGNVANIFGWGYNRSSCYLPSRDDTIQFFFAEDNHLYYGMASDMSKYQRIDYPLAVNPDFDVNCLPNEVVAVSFSDLDQNVVMYGELAWKDTRFEWKTLRLAANGGSYRSAVAPQSRVLGKTKFVSYLKFGYPGTEKMSTAMVAWSDTDQLAPFAENSWKKHALFSIKPEVNQIMPVSLENYKDTMMAILVHPDGSVYFSFFNLEKKDWSDPIKQEIQITGHLEWQTLATADSTYLAYRNADQKLEVARISDEKLEIHTFENLALNAMKLFQDEADGVYVMYNDGLLRRISPDFVSQPIQTSLEKPTNFYFGQISPMVGERPFISWVTGKDGRYELESQYFQLPGADTWKKAEENLPVVKNLKKENFSSNSK